MKIVVQGTNTEVSSLHKEIIQRFTNETGINIGKVGENKPHLTARHSLGQNEILEFIVSVSSGIASAAIYDYIKYKVENNNKIKITKIEEEKNSKNKES